MEVDEFKALLSKKRCRVITFLNWNETERKYGWSYDERADRDKILCDIYHEKSNQKNKLFAWKQMTEFLDYKCDFDEKGKCRGSRRENTEWNTMKCCCKYCNQEVGYLRIIPEARLEYFASIFDPKTGFWKKGAGCQIEDRRERSATCLRYSCHPDERFRNSMYTFSGMVQEIESKILDLHSKEHRHLRQKNDLKRAFENKG